MRRRIGFRDVRLLEFGTGIAAPLPDRSDDRLDRRSVMIEVSRVTRQLSGRSEKDECDLEVGTLVPLDVEANVRHKNDRCAREAERDRRLFQGSADRGRW